MDKTKSPQPSTSSFTSATEGKDIEELDSEMTCLPSIRSTAASASTLSLDNFQNCDSDSISSSTSLDSSPDMGNEPPSNCHNQVDVDVEGNVGCLNPNSRMSSTAAAPVTQNAKLVKIVQKIEFGKPPLPPTVDAKRRAEAQKRKFLCNSKADTEEFWKNAMQGKTAGEVDLKLLKFRLGLRHSREEMGRRRLHSPNLEDMENSVRSSMVIDRLGRALPHSQVFTRTIATNTTPTPFTLGSNQRKRICNPVLEDLEKEWNSLIQKANQNFSRGNGTVPGPSPVSGTFESDSIIPTTEINSKLQLITGSEFCRECKYYLEQKSDHVNTNFPPGASFSLSKKSQSMMNLGSASPQASNLSSCDTTTLRPLAADDDRARSMEFIVDDSDKNAHLRPPENTLMLRQDNRQLSEHELRVQRSLTKLNVPDWYKKYGTGAGTESNSSKQGKNNFGSGTGLAGGWSGLSSSKTSSLTSLQSAGRYSGRAPSSSRIRNTASAGGHPSSRESLMSPSSTASASPSPYYERSSFTYGMPYALTRFATQRMSCGASPASLSPSPSPVGGVGSSTSTPTASGPSTRHSSFTKQPYLGWRSQERLNSKTLYRTPSERLAADLLAQKTKVSISITHSDKSSPVSSVTQEIPQKNETASDLSLNNSDESNNHKLNRVRSSIKEVSNAIVDYVNESKPLDDGTNGRVSPRRGLVWLESSFVGTKPIDSPETPDTPSVVMPASRRIDGAIRNTPTAVYRYDDQSDTTSTTNNRLMNVSTKKEKYEREDGDRTSNQSNENDLTSPSNPNYTTSYLSRNEQMEERSNSTVSSPTLEDILDSLLALRRPNKKIRSRSKGHHSSTTNTAEPVISKESSPVLDIPNERIVSSQEPGPISPISDWQQRMNQPLDSAYFPDSDFLFSSNIESTQLEQNPPLSHSYNIITSTTHPEECGVDNMGDTRSDKTFLDDDAFGILTEVPGANPINSAAVVNAFPCFNESTPSTPARLRRVSFDLDVSDKEEKSSSRSRRDESIGGTIHCRHNKCGKTAVGLEARREFKTCHNCNAYYCSRECRRAHWEKHKKVCMQSRVGALCKQIINHVKDDSHVVSHLSTIAKSGVLAKGRGCVKLFFSSPDRAERFLTGGLPELPAEQYIPSGDMLPEEMGAQIYTELIEQCRTYNMDNRFVLFVTVCVVNEVPTSGAVKWEREMISRSAKLRLLLPRFYEETQRHHHASTTAHLLSEEQPVPETPVYDPDPAPPFPTDDFFPPPGEGETLILRSVPPIPSYKMTCDESRRVRELNFANIMKHLNQRRVELRRTYPDIYSKLCNYVENNESFVPVTIYPRNGITGQQFMCVIMPDSTDISYFAKSDDASHVQTINISEPSYED